MYPFLRFAYHLQRAKFKPKLEHPFIESTIPMRVWLTDIDTFMEMNNGRFLTLMDIGRLEIGSRLGLLSVLKQNKWGLMVGAVSTRFRRRFRPLEKFTLHTKMLYFDERWFYFHQWFTGKDGTARASFLVRTAVISKNGLVPTEAVKEAMNISDAILAKYNTPNEWIEQWVKSDAIHKTIMEQELN